MPEHAVIGGSTQPVAEAAARSCGRPFKKYGIAFPPLPSSPSLLRYFGAVADVCPLPGLGWATSLELSESDHAWKQLPHAHLLSLTMLHTLAFQLKTSTKDANKAFEENWNSRFSWFTKGHCSHITTIRGDKESHTVSLQSYQD